MSVIDRVFPKLPAEREVRAGGAAAGSPFKGLPVPGTASSAVQGAAPAAAEAAAGALAHGPPELLERRRRLQEEFAEAQWNLGGLAYEMAIRDHFRLDVIVRHAARLQKLDAELGEVERLLRLEQAGAAGECPSCSALYSRGAVYCWQCGRNLIPESRVGATAAGES